MNIHADNDDYPERSTETLWHQFAWCKAHMQAYRERILEPGISIERLDAYAGELVLYTSEACRVCAELQHRGLSPQFTMEGKEEKRATRRPT